MHNAACFVVVVVVAVVFVSSHVSVDLIYLFLGQRFSEPFKGVS